MEGFDSGSVWLNRTWCDCIREMKDCAKSLNFGPVMGLLDELGSFGCRMEAALGDSKDLLRISEAKTEGKKELRELEGEIKKRKAELKTLKRKKK